MDIALIAFLTVAVLLVLVPIGWQEIAKGANKHVANGVLLLVIAVMLGVAATFCAVVAVPL